MTTDDIFEAITDIDDRFIAEALTDLDIDQTVIAYPAAKRPLWKTLVPIAACLAVLCAAGAFGVKYLTGRPRSEPSESGDVSFSQPGVVAQNVTKIDIPGDGSEVGFAMEEFPAFNFKASDKAVTSVFTTFEMDVVVENSLFDERIHIDALYLADLNGDGEREICASVYDGEKGHGIMVNDFADGLKYNAETGSVIVDDTAKGTLYTLPSDGKEFEYTLVEEDGVLMAVKTVWQPGYASTIPNELSREPLTLDMMTKTEDAADSELQDFKEIATPPRDARNDFQMEEFPNYTFTATHNEILLNGYEMDAVDVRIMSGNYDYIEKLYLCDLNGDGKRELCATVRGRTINNFSVRSVMVCDFGNGISYMLPGSSSGERWFEVEDGVLKIKYSTKEDRNSYAVSTMTPLLDMMIMIIPDKPLWEISLDNEQTFGIVEFPDIRVTTSDSGVIVGGENLDIMPRTVIGQHTVVGDMQIEKLFLADINGDGKREICAAVTEKDENLGSGIVVYDIANDETYKLKGDMATAYSLDDEDDVLYAVKRDNGTRKEISREPLSLDMTTKYANVDIDEVYLGCDQKFTLPDFDGFEFEVDTSYEYPDFTFHWDCFGSGNSVNAVFFCDLDGDGRREIVLNCPFVGDGCIRVYGFKDNGEMGEALYFENGGCQLIVSDGELKYKSQNSGARPFDYSQFHLKSVFTEMCQYELLDWDRDMHFYETVPITGNYNITISNRTLKIKHKGKPVFDSGTRLGELYTIPDTESNSLVFVFANEADGKVSALKISEEPVMLYRFEEKVTLKPTAEDLHIVYEDGREEPFVFPDSGTLLLQ